MSRLTIVTITAAMLILIVDNTSAQHIAPSALLTIDQNRGTVVERIVGEWGDRLATSNAGVSTVQLRQILSGLRSDHLLAASLAGSVEGLRDVVSGALVRTDAAISPTLIHTKSLGDTTDDLVYTPVVPCRIVDTRSGGGGVFLPGNQRNWLAFSPGGFAAQGGSATNCGIPVRPVAIMANTTLANTVGGPEFFTLWPFNQARPLASTVNWWASAQQPANAEIVPLCTGGGCTSDFSAHASGQTHAIIDVLGYFNRPTNYGGTHTITGPNATDSGGFGNTASGDSSTVGGGSNNTASGGHSTVAGGDTNFATGPNSTVAGGAANNAIGFDSTVAGGFGNIASGFQSTVAGGVGNSAGGSVSFAAGRSANATHDGSFVWGDGTRDANSIGTNSFAVLATGGVGLYVASGQCLLMTGAGGWSCSSDRNGKENFTTLNVQDLLKRLSAVPITRWNAKGAPGVQHIGPMAQDFRAAFGLGEDDLHIGTTDAQGVALAAIQGLHQMIKQKDAKLRIQDRKLHEQSNRISMMERELATIKEKLTLR